MLYNLFSFSLWSYTFLLAVFRSNIGILRDYSFLSCLLKKLKAHNMLSYDEYLRNEIGEEMYMEYVKGGEAAKGKVKVES
jgi:hypothetical protein